MGSESRTEPAACPRCGDSDSNALFEGEDYQTGLSGAFAVARCSGCGLWFLNPRPRAECIPDLYPATYAQHMESPGTEGVTDTAPGLRPRLKRWMQSVYYEYLRREFRYPESSGPGKNAARTAMSRLLSPLCRWFALARLAPRYVAGGRLLEVGCGNGDFLLQLRHMGWKDVCGIELAAQGVRVARAKGLTVDCGRAEEFLNACPDAAFDVIVSSMVIEHLTNPFEVVKLVAAKLKPGGEFVFSTVVRDSADGWLYGRYALCFDFQRHMVFFSKSDLLQMVRDSGFRAVECVHHSAVADFCRPARYRIQRGEGKVLDRLVLALNAVHILDVLCLPMAWMHLTTRVSVRCVKPAS